MTCDACTYDGEIDREKCEARVFCLKHGTIGYIPFKCFDDRERYMSYLVAAHEQSIRGAPTQRSEFQLPVHLL